MKTVLITGASSGIGYALAETYAKNSYNLVLVARREAKLLELKNNLEKNHGISVAIEAMDLSLIENINKLYEKYASVNIFINNAGFGQFGEFNNYNLETDLKMISLNINSLVILTKLYAKSMKKGDKIINIGSTAGFQPIPLMATYGASKSFVVDFTLAISQEIQEPQIILFCPGETLTEFQEVAHRPKSSPLRGKIPTATEVAEYLFREVNKGKTFIIWGRYNKFLLNFQKLLPKTLTAKIIYKTQKR